MIHIYIYEIYLIYTSLLCIMAGISITDPQPVSKDLMTVRFYIYIFFISTYETILH